MAAKRPKSIPPPTGGLWRVGCSPDPLRFSDLDVPTVRGADRRITRIAAATDSRQPRVTKAGATGVERAIDTPWIEIRE